MPLTDVFCPICYKTEFVKVTRKSLQTFDHRSLHENVNIESDDDNYKNNTRASLNLHHHHHHHNLSKQHPSLRRLSMYEKELRKRDARIKSWLQQSNQHNFSRIKVLNSFEYKPKNQNNTTKLPIKGARRSSLIAEEEENDSDGFAEEKNNNLPYAAPYAASTPQSMVDILKDDLLLPPLKADLTKKISKNQKTPNPSVISPINLDKTEKIDFPFQELENGTKESVHSKKSEKINLSRSPSFDNAVEKPTGQESPFRITINKTKDEEPKSQHSDKDKNLFGIMEREKSIQAKSLPPPQVEKKPTKRGNEAGKKPGSPIPAEIKPKNRNLVRRRAKTPPLDRSSVKARNPVRRSYSNRVRTPSDSEQSEIEKDKLPKLVKFKKNNFMLQAEAKNNRREENLPNINEKRYREEEPKNKSKPKYIEDTEHEEPETRREKRRDEDEPQYIEKKESSRRSKDKYRDEEYSPQPEKRERRREKRRDDDDEPESFDKKESRRRSKDKHADEETSPQAEKRDRRRDKSSNKENEEEPRREHRRERRKRHEDEEVADIERKESRRRSKDKYRDEETSSQLERKHRHKSRNRSEEEIRRSYLNKTVASIATSPIIFETSKNENKETYPIIHDNLSKSLDQSLRVSPNIKKIYDQSLVLNEDKSLLPSSKDMSTSISDSLMENKNDPPPPPPQNIIKTVHHHHYYPNATAMSKPSVSNASIGNSSPIPPQTEKQDEIVISVERDGSTQVINVKKRNDLKASKLTPEPALKHDQQFILPLQSAFIYDDDARSDTSGSSRPVTSHSAKRPQVVVNNPNIIDQSKNIDEPAVIIYKYGETPIDQSFIEEKRYVNEAKKLHDMLNEKIDTDATSEALKRPLSTIEEDETDENGEKTQSQQQPKPILSKLKLNKLKDQEQLSEAEDDVESTLTLESSRTIRNVKFDNNNLLNNENGKPKRKILLPSEREISSREKAVMFVNDNFSNHYKIVPKTKNDDEVTVTTQSGDEPTIRVTSGSIASKSDKMSVMSEPVRRQNSKTKPSKPIIKQQNLTEVDLHPDVLDEIKEHIRLVESFRKDQGLHPKEKQTFYVNPPNSAPVPVQQQQQYSIDQLVYPNEHMYYYNHHPHSSLPYHDPNSSVPYYDPASNTYYTQQTQNLYHDPYTQQLIYPPHFQQPNYPYYPHQPQMAYMAIEEPIHQPNTTPNESPVKQLKKPKVKKNGPALIISNNTDTPVVLNQNGESKAAKNISTVNNQEIFEIN